MALVVLPVTTICSCVCVSSEPINIEGQCLGEHCSHKCQCLVQHIFYIVTLSKGGTGCMTEIIISISITIDETIESNDKGDCNGD